MEIFNRARVKKQLTVQRTPALAPHALVHPPAELHAYDERARPRVRARREREAHRALSIAEVARALWAPVLDVVRRAVVSRVRFP